ncbi:MAG TPA: PilX N-terminal domain-containing pilus assembly protein [Steroidobacteraceae bacterium]
MKGMTSSPGRQQGAALVIGLVLLLVLTILAVSGVFTSTMELRMTGNTQLQERAFQSAELAIEEALANPLLSTSAPEVQALTNNPNSPGDQYSYTLQYVCRSELGVGATGYSLGAAGFTAYHFQVDATGTAPGNALADHVQNFFIVGPPDSTNC